MKKCTSIYLLTDILPAELPIIFSNKQFYSYFSSSERYLDLDRDTNLPTVPVQFKVKKGDHDFRLISLMNPVSELIVTRFVNKYAKLILLYFQQNTIFSIRVYNRINDHFVEMKDKDIAEIRAILEPGTWDIHGYLEDKFIRHYFNVIKFPKITDFYRSFYLKDLEIQYKYMLKLDIKSCFDNIYTHSVDWAYLGNKRFAKEYVKIGNRFSAELDQVMQYANYKETHGILIGPEFSRMFAEIILTRIDCKVYEDLCQKGIRFKKDYEIVRFVDDIFVFSSNREYLDIIERIIRENLSIYKLSLNDGKRDVEKVPFMRKHLWVQRAKKIISELTVACENISKKPQNKAFYNNVWNEIRCLCVEYESQMSYIISYFFSAFEKVHERQMESLDNLIMKEPEENSNIDYAGTVCSHLARWVDLIAQSLAFSLSHNNILKYSRMCIKILKKYREDKYSVESIVFKKTYLILKHHQDSWTEMQNLVITLSLVKERMLPPDLLQEFLERDSGYLSLATIAFYIRKCDPAKVYYQEIYVKINGIIRCLLNEWADIYNIDFDKTRCIGEKDLKKFLCSDAFYTFHDFYSSQILDEVNLECFTKIKQQIINNEKGGNKNSLYVNYLGYIKNLDKPFMRWNVDENELIADYFLEKQYKKFQYD